METLGLYIHIPFCRRKCHYCDFVSFPGTEDIAGSYIDSLVSEARMYEDYFNHRIIDTVYIGGGTPSLLPPELIVRLMNELGEIYNFRLKEATIEANPETMDEEKPALYASSGINRISIGLQTHDDGILKVIGRRHTFETFVRAYESAENYIDNINVDTIFGLPGQTTDSFRATIRHIIELNPSHLSAYSLKLEPGTKLHEDFTGCDEDNDRDMYHSASYMLAASGYLHYETSNFAKEGSECLHNLKYWTGGEYLGLGVAAHSNVSSNGNFRHSNVETLEDYFRLLGSGKKPIINMTELSDHDAKEEYLMLRLRLKKGIAFHDYDHRFKSSFKMEFKEPIEESIKTGLITLDAYGIYPTLKGFDLQNTLICEFMKNV